MIDSTEDREAYDACAALNDECTCQKFSRPPCASMLDLVTNNESARDELLRMERARTAAQGEAE